MEIYFQNIKNFFIKSAIKKAYLATFKELNLMETVFAVNIKFVSSAEIQELNKTFREIDKPTDVLSFPNFDFEKGKKEILAEDVSVEDGLVNLGDIAICKEIAKAQALEYGHSYKREVCFLALHGLLHLLGFDHIEEKDAKLMERLADKILKKVKVTRDV